MRTVSVIALAEHQHAGRRLRPHDVYECDENVVAHFQKLGWVRRRDDTTTDQSYQTREMTAAAPAAIRKRRR